MPHTLTTREAEEEKRTRWSWVNDYLNSRFQRAKRMAEGAALEHGTAEAVEITYGWDSGSLSDGSHYRPGQEALCRVSSTEMPDSQTAERLAEAIKAIQAIAQAYNEERAGLIEDLEEENRKTDGLVSDDADTHKEAIKRAQMKVAQAEKNLRDAKEWLMIIKQDAEKAGVEMEAEKE